MEISYLGVALATIAQFAVGAVWYTFLFAKLWGKIHGFDKLPPETQQAMMKEIMPYYALQLLVTVFGAAVLAILINAIPSYSPYYIAFLVWLGFIVPAQVSAVIFGGTEGKWIWTKIGIQAGAALFCIMAGAAVLSFF